MFWRKRSSRNCSICVSSDLYRLPGAGRAGQAHFPYLSPARQKIYSQIKQSISSSQRSTQAKVDFREYCNSTKELIETLLMQGKNPLFLDQMSRHGRRRGRTRNDGRASGAAAGNQARELSHRAAEKASVQSRERHRQPWGRRNAARHRKDCATASFDVQLGNESPGFRRRPGPV